MGPAGFSTPKAGPRPHVGHSLLALAPALFAGGDVAPAVAGLAAGFEPAGARLPGRNRKDPGPVEVDADLWARVLSLTKG